MLNIANKLIRQDTLNFDIFKKGRSVLRPINDLLNQRIFVATNF